MIALKRRRGVTDIPVAFREPKLTASAQKLIDIFYAGQQTGKFEFKSSAWSPAKPALKKESGNKCAYCEAPTSVVAHGDVEHFRPKSQYWWLAFCIDNYVFSCQICNQTHKGNKFPISGQLRLTRQMPDAKPGAGQALDALVKSLVLDSSLLNEQQLRDLWASEDADLVHPYLEDPEPLFRYEVDMPNEEIVVRSAGTPRADRAMAAAEDTLGINREELRRVRYAHYLPLATFKVALDRPIADDLRQIIIDQVRRMQEADAPFAGMVRYFAKTWGLPGPPP